MPNARATAKTAILILVEQNRVVSLIEKNNL